MLTRCAGSTPIPSLPDQVSDLRSGGHSAWRTIVVAVPMVLVLVTSGCGNPREEAQPPLGDTGTEEPGTEDTGATSASGGDEADPSPQTFTFVSAEFDFTEAPKRVPPGEYVIRLVNDGLVTHDVTIEELGDRTVVEASGGETDEGAVTLKPGTYTYYCSVPGHRLAGMEGTLEVAESAN